MDKCASFNRRIMLWRMKEIADTTPFATPSLSRQVMPAFSRRRNRGHSSDSQRRPGDVFIPHWRNRPHAFDVAVTSPLCASNLQQASTNTGAAVEKMKQLKINKHFQSCRQQGISFVPLVVETLGGWDSEASFHLSKIAEMTAQRSDKKAALVSRHFFQRLSVLLQRANASLMA